MTDQTITRKHLAWIAVGAFFWRIAISALTPVPSEDGANYLWMAERFAEGRPDLALSEVFGPLYSLAAAPFVYLGLDPFRAGQLAACIGGALAVVPIVRICERFVPGCGRIAALFVAFAPLPTRFAGEVYTEPMLHAFGAMALWTGLRGRFFESGLWTGMAFWLRPEAAVVAVGFALHRPRAAWPALPAALVPVLGLAYWRASQTGGPFELVPKLGFNADRLWEGGTPGVFDFLANFGGNALQIPWLWCEAFVFLGVLAVVGLFRRGDPRLVPLRLMLLLGIVVICAFLARRRFLVTWFFVAMPFAMLGLQRLGDRARDVAVILVLVSGVLLSLKVQDANRYAEREVGEYLASKLNSGEGVSGDMTRVIYFAGRRPLPPRHFSVDELVERAMAPQIRFVVLGSKRATTPPVRDQLIANGFAKYDVPEEIRREADRRGVLVLERR